MTQVGVISDTHGLMRPEALKALVGSDYIMHAGDVGSPDVLEALGKIAPVTAVEGNVDAGKWNPPLPKTEVLNINGVMIYMLHVLDQLDLNPATAGFKVVLYGHSHRATWDMRGGVLYLNPGSAGPRRFKLPISVAILQINESDGAIDAEIVDLNI
jgi:uncharacterized protein